MPDRWLAPVTLSTAVAAAVMGGVFFAFSTFVLGGLGRATPAQGMAAMQGINRAAPTPLFMIGLFGTALASIVLGVASLSRLDTAAGGWRLAGAVAYMVPIVLTIAYHVPRNDALAAVSAEAPEAARLWATYLREWTSWNHLRTLGAIAAAVAFTVAERVA
jgi:uncharacterized membrane protein